jgi:hypothetical protein
MIADKWFATRFICRLVSGGFKPTAKSLAMMIEAFPADCIIDTSGEPKDDLGLIVSPFERIRFGQSDPQ